MVDVASGERRPSPSQHLGLGRTAEFETLYRENVTAVTSYFARRTGNPQTAADLTADTFVAAITSIASFDPARGSARAWLFGIARKCFAGHHELLDRDRAATTRLQHRRELEPDETGELLERIAAEEPGRLLLAELSTMSEADREAVDLVYLAGLRPRDAAEALGVTPGALRVRLFRVRSRLRTVTDPREEDDRG